MANYKSERRKDLGKWLEKFFDIDHSDPDKAICLAEDGFSLLNIVNTYIDIRPKIEIDVLKDLLALLPYGRLRLVVANEIKTSDPTFDESKVEFNQDRLKYYDMIDPAIWNTPDQFESNYEIFHNIVRDAVAEEYNMIHPSPSPSLMELSCGATDRLYCSEANYLAHPAIPASFKRFLSIPTFKSLHWTDAIYKICKPTEATWALDFFEYIQRQYEAVRDSLIIHENKAMAIKTIKIQYENQAVISILASRILIEFFELGGQFHYSFCRNPQCGRFHYHTQDSRKSKPLKWCGKKCNNAVNNPKNQTKNHHLQTK